MVYNIIAKYENILYTYDTIANSSNTSENVLSANPDEAKIMIATILSFTSGVILVCFFFHFDDL